MKPLQCPEAPVLELAAGKLPPAEAQALTAHIAACPACQQTLEAAHAVVAATQTLARAPLPPLPDALRERLWTQLAPVAERAAADARTHAAVRHLARSRYGALAAAAVLVAVAGALWSAQALRQAPVPQSAIASNVHVQLPQGLRHQPVVSAAPPVVAVPTEPAPLSPLVADHAPRVNVLHLACGAAVHRAGADVHVTRDEPGLGVVRLDGGIVQVEVPKLPEGARMAVETREARVEVKGTRFSVSHTAEGTTVHVTEGTVWVTPAGKGRALEVLTAGQTTRVPGADAYRSGLRQQLQGALSAKAWAEVATLAHRLLDTLDEGTEADGLRLQLAAVAARAGEANQAVALAEQVAAHGALDLTRQNALAFAASVYHGGKQGAAELAVWQRYRQLYPTGAHASQALERLVQLTCGQATAEAAAVRHQLRAQGTLDAGVAALLQRCEPETR